MGKKPGKSPKRGTAVASSGKKVLSDTCFVLMPFGGWFDQYYEVVYRSAIEAAGLTPKRADDIYRPGTIVNDIWAFTNAAKLLLADLTDRNPNVFYELGLAHALAKPVILVTESIDQVPFDLRALRVIEYEKNDPAWGDVLRDKITKAIGQVVDAPLEAVLPAFLKVQQRAKQGTVTEHEKAILELRRDFDLLRREIRIGGQRELPTISSPEEADATIRRYLKSGLPDPIILRRLSERGVPTGWVTQRISEMRAPSPPTRSSPPDGKSEKPLEGGA